MNAKKARTKSGRKGKSLLKASTKSPGAKSPTGARTSASRTTRRSSKPTVTYAAIAVDPYLANLDRIKHVVVLMMENRSFDQMLGYLKLKGGRNDMNGLVPEMANAYNGKAYPIHHQTSTTLRSRQDPCHDGRCVSAQLADGNQGFVRNYAETHPGYAEYELVMGYFDEAQVSAYDFLAEEFTVCDQWYSSVRGATWPNRLYALAVR